MSFNLAWQLERAAHARSAHPAVALGTQVLHDYAALYQRAGGLAAGLTNTLGARGGDRVLIAMANAPAYLETLYACWHAGLVPVPVNARLHRDEFAYMAGHCDARVVIADAARASLMPADARVIEAGSREYRALLATAAGVPAHTDIDDVAWLFYTSGTTGRPKGASLTYRNLQAMLLGYFVDVDPGGPWTSIVHAAPLSHGSGLYALAHTAKASCHVIPASAGFDAGEVHALLDHWQGVSMFAAPTMVKRLVDHRTGDARGLATLMYGGGPMYVADCQAALARFGPHLSQLFGQGESPMTITALDAHAHVDVDHPRYLERLGSVGIAQTPVQVRVVDDSASPLPAGAAGEVVVRGESVMRGYWNDEVATAAAIRNGWLHTGDIGVLDEDGFLTLKDRAKDLVISGGSNIYPREVEEVLARHDAVAEVAVIGEPHAEWGESLVAVVVAREGSDTDRLTTALDMHCLDSMARYKRPRTYRFVDALPKNNAGKVLKRELRS